jgi:CheY-like chemotaxis protein
LVAEDNPVNQRIVSRLLVGLGCTGEVVSDGAEALALLETKRFDLVLMDAQMPVLDGLEATRRLRLTEQGRTQRVVALTANATDEVRRACEEAGMDAFLTKPVSREQLRGTLAEIMVRSVAA